MPIVRNRKGANVNLQSGKILVEFKSGDHEYGQDLLDGLDMSRAVIRAYFDGPDPVLSVLNGSDTVPEATQEPEDPEITIDEPEEPLPTKAVELAAALKTCNDVELLKNLAENDERSTVCNAALKRLEVLGIDIDA